MKIVYNNHSLNDTTTDIRNNSYDSSKYLLSKPICRLVMNNNNDNIKHHHIDSKATNTGVVPITIVRFTADGKYCFTVGQDKKVILWNPLRVDPAFKSSSLSSYKQFNENNIDNDIDVTHIPRGLPIQTYIDGIRYIPTALAINDTSSHILIGTNKTAILMDCITTQMIRQFQNGHTAVINSVAMYSSCNNSSSSGTTSSSVVDQIYATASYDATVCLWDARTSNNAYRPIQTLKDAKDSVTVVDIPSSSSSSSSTQSGTYTIRTASVDGIVRTYDIRQGMLQCDNYGSPIISMSSIQVKNTNYLAVSCLDGVIRVVVSDNNHDTNNNWNDTNTGKTIQPKYICRNGHVAGQYALECCFVTSSNNNDTCILTGSEDGNAVLYNLTTSTSNNNNKYNDETKKEAHNNIINAPVRCTYMGHTGPTCSVASYTHYSHDDNDNTHQQHKNVIITASYDGQCIVWSNSNI